MTALLLIMVGFLGFVVGWAAHRDDNQRYAQARERYWERQLAESLADRERALAEAVRVPAPTVAPAVVHVHMPPGRPTRVIEAEVVDELPPVVPVDLDALTLRKELTS